MQKLVRGLQEKYCKKEKREKRTTGMTWRNWRKVQK